MILRDCHHVHWRTDAIIFHGDEAYLNELKREGGKPRVIWHLQCLWFLNKHRSTDQPDETNVKRFSQCVHVCMCRDKYAFYFHLSCLRANQV